jgi:hypothetical protein
MGALAMAALLLAAGPAPSQTASGLTDAELVGELAARGVIAESTAKDAEGPSIAELSTEELVREFLAREKVIYGLKDGDGRRDLYEVSDPARLRRSLSVGALIRNARLQRDANGRWKMPGAATLRTAKAVCSSEAFAEQPLVAFCTSFLVAPNVALTAGHCVGSEDELATFKVVFGFGLRSKSVFEPVADKDVYTAVKLRGRVEDPQGADWAVLELDRPVVNRDPLALRPRGLIPNKEPLYVIGFPLGLPMKIAGGAEVRSQQDPSFFVANLDTYGGNSGSPVFSNLTGEVEGILVRGETDFVRDDAHGCAKSKVCPTTGCRGEDVTRVLTIPGELLQ